MIAKPEHEVAFQDLCALVAKHADAMTPLEVLAIASNMLGKLVALQDQRTMTPAQAMEIVARNLEEGNRQIIDGIGSSRGSASPCGRWAASGCTRGGGNRRPEPPSRNFLRDALLTGCWSGPR